MVSSHPLRVRGLKSRFLTRIIFSSVVAPSTGAWIEISLTAPFTKSNMSHPLRVRGLKFLPIGLLARYILSHPLRVRGLKYIYLPIKSNIVVSHPLRVRGLKLYPVTTLNKVVLVAPSTGAWIEIGLQSGLGINVSSHPLRVRGLK